MKLLAFIYFCCFVYEATSEIYNLTTSHQTILDEIFPQLTNLEKRLVSELPEDFVSRFPILDRENTKDINPDIFWRLPVKYFQLSGSDLGNLVREASQDPTIIWKATAFLRKASESDRLEFLNLLPDLPASCWDEIGELECFPTITMRGCLHCT